MCFNRAQNTGLSRCALIEHETLDCLQTILSTHCHLITWEWQLREYIDYKEVSVTSRDQKL